MFAAGDGSIDVTSSPHTLTTSRPDTIIPEPRSHTLRLRLKPKAPTTGFVDGGWWPHSRDLVAELPALLAVLAVRPGRIEGVTYNLTRWEPAARRTTVAGDSIRLDGFCTQHPDTVTVTGHDRQRLTLLVIPPEATSKTAHDALMRASQRGNTDSTETLLALSRTRAVPVGVGSAESTQSSTERWELDGGRVQ